MRDRAPVIVISGITGAIGCGLAERLLACAPREVMIAGLFRSRLSHERFMQAMGEAARGRIFPLWGDLADGQIEGIDARIRDAERLVGVHCAADVSWEKDMAELSDLNVTGSLTFARLIADNHAAPRLVYVSSAYTRMEGWSYRNGYEESKAAGERAVRATFPEMSTVTFSCSLVVGRTSDGAIGRFHGLYPLIKLMAVMMPPFLVGRANCLIDIVPIDWVARELAAQTLRHLEGDAPDPVVAAAGCRRIRAQDMVEIIEGRINAFREAHSFEPNEALTLLPFRRWRFLRSSLAKWQPAELPAKEFRYFERLLEVYKPYVESDEVLAPENITSPAPDPVDVLPCAVDYWLNLNRDLVLAKARKNAEAMPAWMATRPVS